MDTSSMFAEFQETMRLRNEARDNLTALLTFKTTAVGEKIAQTINADDFEEASEFGVPMSQPREVNVTTPPSMPALMRSPRASAVLSSAISSRQTTLKIRPSAATCSAASSSERPERPATSPGGYVQGVASEESSPSLGALDGVGVSLVAASVVVVAPQAVSPANSVNAVNT